MPSLVNDGVKFFPNVLRTRVFQENGILFGQEPGGKPGYECKGNVCWAVIDPRKHKLYIWQKTQPYFPDSAVKLGASVFTNGSFNLYSGGRTGATAHILYDLEVVGLWAEFGGIGVLTQQDAYQSELGLLKRKYFGDSVAQGYIYGNREHIVETKNSRPHQHYFGRRADRFFPDYEINEGDPPPIAEFIGGLFRTVENYDIGSDSQDAHKQSNDFGYWGLAPLSIQDKDLKEGSIESALEELQNYDRQHNPDLSACLGVLITVFYGGNTQELAKILISARVKDAVRIDGSDSILFGHGAEILVGKDDEMSDAKKLYNKWGYQCQKE